MTLQILISILVLTNFYMLGTSRLGALIRTVAGQAFFLCILTLFIQKNNLEWHSILFIAVATLVKTILLPVLIKRALRGTLVRREIEPLLGYAWSLFLGLTLLGGSIWAAANLPLPNHNANPTVIALAFFTIFTGLLLIVTRSKAITQVIGYLSMENGIFLLGLAVAAGSPVIVEMGILLDVFVGVFVMGIMVSNINREFDHINTQHLTVLKD